MDDAGLSQEQPTIEISANAVIQEKRMVFMPPSLADSMPKGKKNRYSFKFSKLGLENTFLTHRTSLRKQKLDLS